MKMRGTATDRLSDVIQTLSLARKSGVLVVERDGFHGQPELGMITFQNGQIADARVGPLQGNDAFKKLMTWTTCHFVLQPPSAAVTSPLQHPDFSPQRPSPMPTDPNETYRRPPEDVIPYRAMQFHANMPDFQALGLSRMHRQLFLLIDGKRPVQVLARLIGRHSHDVRIMLADLERTGLIHQ